jgi:hypothetical protein
MRRPTVLSPSFLFILVCGLCTVVGTAFADEPTDAPAATGDTFSGSGQRKLAPGVLKVIPFDREEEETFSGPRPFVEITDGPFKDWDPDHFPKSEIVREMAAKTVFRRQVWHLEFAFKPMRLIEVDIPPREVPPPGKPAKLEKKLIWYMVYRIRNTGYHMLSKGAEAEKAGEGYTEVVRQNYPIHFFPTFVMETHGTKKSYLDRVIPVAVKAIQKREDPNTTLLNSVEIGRSPIEVSTDRVDKSVWGVVTWEDVDPRTDYFSVYIQGLTNAYRWEDPEGAYTVGDPPGTGRLYTFKTLQMNFWRPGDEINEKDDKIKFGIPGDAEYRWIYRAP